MPHTVALFGESERGEFRKGYICRSLFDLAHTFGEPPKAGAKGLEFAVQAILYQRDVLFFRVHEEGFSVQDYIRGFSLLEEEANEVTALCLPGVGSGEIIEATHSLCQSRKSFLIITEKDLYDYLTYTIK